MRHWARWRTAGRLAARPLRGSAPLIKTPVFAALAGRDCVCDNEAAMRFYERLGTPDRQIKPYSGFLHSLEYGPDRVRFLDDWLAWIQAHDTQTSMRS